MSNADPNKEVPSILVVDDTPDNLALMGGILRDSYRVRVANNGERALRIAGGEEPPDLILLDIMMPGMDGYQVCQRLKEAPSTRDIPVIFLTARSDPEDERRGLALGAVDYITKPISPPIVLARIKTHLDLKAAADFLRDKNAFLEKEVAKRTQSLQLSNHQLRQLAVRIETVAEAERKSIAQEMHDELGQMLTSLKLDLRWLMKRTAETGELRERLDAMNEVLGMTIASVRKITFGLRPRILDELGVVAAIEAHLKDLACREIEYSLEVPRRDIEVDSERGLSIFRIFQESMTNILRHAEANRVEILLDISLKRVVLQVSDNGRGMNPGDARDSKSLGLIVMRERAMRWGGRVEIAAAPGFGTTVRATIPMPGAAGQEGEA
ncbi:MAG TPA: response regulator [Geomonas sp.]|nr:response regulator [Geomonas sp.]